MFREGSGDWTQYRKLESAIEIDFHYSQYGRREIPYEEAMDQIYQEALQALQKAREQGVRYVIFTHGASTSRPGRTTARSQVRRLMRSKEATPFVSRKDCIQHNSVFVAAIRKALV